MNETLNSIKIFIKYLIGIIIALQRKLVEVIIKKRPILISNKEFLSLMNYGSLNEFFLRSKPQFHINSVEKEVVLKKINQHPKLVEKCIQDADKICNHIFDLLGSGETNIGENINWHKDFKSGYTWNPEGYYVNSDKHLDYMKKGIEADVKIPWELSRFQHLATLGKAFWYTQDKKYVQEFIIQIKSWINDNPIKLGVNWTCTMDVSIRAVNWIWAYYFFDESNILTPEFRTKFIKTLYLHGRHIRNNLEFGKVRGNHYLTNIAALVYLGIFFRESEEAQEWLSKGKEALIKEMDYQTQADGVHSELSTSYHRLTTEIFISTTLLCLKNNIKLPESYMNRLEKMIEFVLYYTTPNGSAPQIGDCDDGRFQILSNYFGWKRQDHQYLLTIGEFLFKREDLKKTNHKFDEESFWLTGGLIEQPPNIPKKPHLQSKSFKNSGFYVMRHDDLYMIINASSPNTQYLQGHRHNDALSFELFAYGKSLIVDPGSYIYTANPKMRNLFRSTKYHNTIQVNEIEQNEFNDDLFYLGTETKTNVSKWDVTDYADFFEGEHYAYKRLKNPVTHQRQILFNKKMKFWVVKDILICEGSNSFDLYFHFSDGEIESFKYPHSFINTNNEIKIAIIPLKTKKLSFEVLEGFVSPSYGIKNNALVLKYSKEGKGTTHFSNLIVPFRKEEELTEILNNEEIF